MIVFAMKSSVAALVVLCGGLTACASTEKILASQPHEVVESSKNINEVAFCLGNKNNVPVLERADGSKVIQIKNGVGAAGMIFSVYPNGSGSRVEIRKPIGVSIAAHRQCY